MTRRAGPGRAAAARPRRQARPAPKRTATTKRSRRLPRRPGRPAIAAVPVTAAQLRALRRQIDERLRPARWNPAPDDVQRSVAQLVLTIVEFLRKLMERQAIRRMEQKTLTRGQVEDVGVALMRLEETIREIGARFGLAPEDLNLDLGPVGRLM